MFRQWEQPANFKIEMFVVRVGDSPIEIHKLCLMLPAFTFEARVVIPVEEAIRGELEVMAWRDGLTFDQG